MIKARTVGGVHTHTHTHTSNFREIKEGAKAFINSIKKTDYKNIACPFCVQKKRREEK